MRKITCEGCGDVFVSDWPEEKAREEFMRLYPGEDFDASHVICDVCHQKIMAMHNQKGALQ